MKHFFENIKTIIGEFIGLIGGMLWASNSKWDYEPVILSIVSGIGLLISIALLVIKKGDSNVSVTPATPITIPETNASLISNQTNNSAVNNIEPKAIKETIKNAPPFQRNATAKNFIGLNVEWNLQLFMIHTRESNSVIVSMEPLDQEFLRINFKTDIEKYPILKIAHKKTKFKVTGKIILCSIYDIELEITNLQAI